MFRDTFYTFLKRIEEVSNRKIAANKVDRSKIMELDWLDNFLEKNGDKEVYGSTYSRVYKNYRDMLEADISQ